MSTNPAPAVRSPWIHSPIYDVLFFIGTPLLCLAAFLPLRGVVSSESIWLFVMAFSSFGHHLPGFLRAYGDAELLQRFKLRFLLAPPLVYLVFLWFGTQEMDGMLLILMLWSIWHVMMQHFGFMRIYDAKVGSLSPMTALLDRALSLLWFVSIVLWSQEYTHNLLNGFYESGGALLPLGLIDGIRWTVWGATAIVTLVYIVHTARLIARKEPLSKIKLVLNVITLGFLWIVWVGLRDIYLGLAVWEVFHDIQYFAITWVYNRRLVEKGFGTTKFMNFLFRKRAPMIGLYVAAIAAYGSFNWFVVSETTATLNTALMAFVLTSTLLHYYYDGFIWKVRQERTREGLDLDSSRGGVGTVLPAGARGALVQVLGFAIPIGSLAAMELAGEADPVAMRESIAEATPRALMSQLNVGRAYSDAGRFDDAVRAYERALAIAPDDAAAHGGLATSLLESSGAERADEAAEHLQRASELAPEDSSHSVNLAILRFSQRRTQEALDIFTNAVQLEEDWQPRSPSEQLLFGVFLMSKNDFLGACQQFATVLDFEPDNQDALEALAFSARSIGRLDTADKALLRLLELTPDRHSARVAYIQNLNAMGRTKESLPLLDQLVVDVPEDYDSKLMLAEILATSPDAELRDGARAVRVAREVVEFTKQQNAGALDILGAALAESGDFAQALELTEKALKLAEAQGFVENANQMRERIQLYSRGVPYHVPVPSEAAK